MEGCCYDKNMTMLEIYSEQYCTIKGGRFCFLVKSFRHYQTTVVVEAD